MCEREDECGVDVCGVDETEEDEALLEPEPDAASRDERDVDSQN